MDFNSNSGSSNMPSSSSVPLLPMPQYDPEAWQRERMNVFWKMQLSNIKMAGAFKSQLRLPLARIKRIMKSEGEAKMLSAEAPVLMSKACEIFIQELALRSWMCAEKAYKNTVEPSDVAKAIVETDYFDFLTDILPPELLQPLVQGAQEGNVVEGENQAALPHETNFMGNSMMNTGNQEGNIVNIAAENQVALPFGASFMGHSLMNIGSVGNAVEGGNQAALLYNANFMGNPMMNIGNVGVKVNLEGNAGNQAALPYGASFMGNPTMITGYHEGNAVNLAAGNQATLSYSAALMGTPMQNKGNEEGNDLNITRGKQVAMPNSAGFMGNPMIDMGSNLAASSQQFPQSYMMQPQFMPSDKFPYNFRPK